MKNQKIIFKQVFGNSWNLLPQMMKKRFSIKQKSNDKIIVKGVLDIYCGYPLKLFSPIMWILKLIPPHTQDQVPVTVTFKSNKQKSFNLQRVFHFKQRGDYHFNSTMFHIQENKIVQRMNFGISWKMKCVWQEEKVKMIHLGYAINFFNYFLIPLPLTFLVGQGYAQQIPIDQKSFRMWMQIRHPIWGKFYQYKGTFQIMQQNKSN